MYCVAARLICFLLLGLSTVQTHASIGPEQLALLETKLTPVGAERAGNADGSIPPWTGGLPQQALDPAVGYTDPFAGDPILFTITAANAEQFAEMLSAGHLAMLRKYPDSYQLNVYPTRRSVSWPEHVLAEVKNQAPIARTQGFALLDVGKSAVPFPLTSDPLQMMWNHVLRWRGGSVMRENNWFPVDRKGRYFNVRTMEAMAFDQQGYMKESRPNRLFNFYGLFLAPASVEGQITLVWEPINPVAEGRRVWTYTTVLRRVVRDTRQAYDDMDRRTQGLRTSDQFDGWNGAPDLYDWKLLGKREMYIGYNSYRLSDKTLKYAEILKPGHPNPDLLRYELHRVWVIEATLRPDEHHRYPRRIFYLDEDTWQVSMEDVYDSDGQLWRFGDHHVMQFYDVQVPWYRAMVHYDLKSDAYLVSELDNESKKARRWGWKGDVNDFLPVNLRRLGTR
jgi:hypothetical protein